jgi:subtilase family serine protease
MMVRSLAMRSLCCALLVSACRDPQPDRERASPPAPETALVQRSAGALGVASGGPDFAVDALTSPASSSTPGGSFQVTVRVCNLDDMGASAEVNVVLSADPVIGTGDAVVGGTFLGWISGFQCAQQTFTVFANVPDGAYTLGAIADPNGMVGETNEANNTRAAGDFGVGFRADWVVSAVSGPPSIQDGAPFQASATVCNRGTSMGGMPPVAIVLSSDATIDPMDFRAGTASVPSLQPGDCATVQVNGTASVPPGAWWLGAIADPDGWDLELIETNNARAGALTGIGLGPDFVVTSVSGPPSAFDGGSFQAQATVCNRGTMSGGGEVRLYLSSDGAITTSDADVGGAPFPFLAAGQCAAVNVNANAFVPPGAWVLGAIADPFNFQTELLESNNALAGATMGIGNGPDFVVRSVSGPASASPGQTMWIQIEVCNDGTMGGTPPHAIAVLSSDAQPTPQDFFIGSAFHPFLMPGQCATASASGNPFVPDGLYTLGAIVDPDGMAFELQETNNARASGLIGVGNAPDLIVSSITAPPSAPGGSSFLAQVTVCNQGTTSGTAAVDLFFSTDQVRSQQDMFAGSVFPPFLMPGQCFSQGANLNASVPDGAYWVLGEADATQGLMELNEGNNLGVSAARIGVGFRPDFVVSAVSGPPSAISGQSFQTQVTVCNQGTTSGSTWVDVLISSDEAFTSADTFIGGQFTSWLMSGQCETVQVQGSAWVSDGLWFLGAIADAFNGQVELIEDNNATSGGAFAVGNGPDLTVAQVTAPPSLVPGSPLQTTVRICNQGTASGGASVDVFLSADATITTLDTYGGGTAGPWLMPGQCGDVTVNGPPASTGIWFVGAIVDAFNSTFEINETNNARAGNRIGVGSQPELVVSSVSGPPSVAPGAQYAVAVTVCNQGTTSVSPPYEVFLSGDTSITTLDPSIGGGVMPVLAPGACATQTVTSTVGAPDGTYHWGAIVDSFNSVSEFFEDNNATAGNRVGFGLRPDLVVSSVSGPPSAFPGGTITAAVTVCNQGTQMAPAQADVFASVDGQISTMDFLVGGSSGPGLMPGQCTTLNVSGPAPGTGLYTLGAIADSWQMSPELFEDNNTGTGGLLGVGSSPDFVVSAVSAPPSAMGGQQFQVQVTVCNQGTTSGSTPVDAVLSSDEVFSTMDTLIGGQPSPWLMPGQCETVQVQGGAWVPDGPWFVGAIADAFNGQAELIETNNTRSGGVLAVGNGPDLTVTQVTAPPSTLPGSSWQAQVTVCNQGTAPGGAPVDLFLSSDETITGQDLMVGGAGLPSLSPGQCQQVAINAFSSPTGIWFVGAIVDSFNGTFELIETNNTRSGGRIGIDSQPDLVIASVSGPPSVAPGPQSSVTVTVCNQGTMSAPGSFDVVLSTDSTITTSDQFMGGGGTPPLAPGECATQTVTVAGGAPDGTYFWGAIADTFNSVFELFEDNNSRAGNRVGFGMMPDLVVSSVSGPPTVVPGGTINASVTVCNQGTQMAPFQVDLFASLDGQISTADFLVGGSGGPSLAPGQCSTVNVSGPAPGPGLYTLGAIADAPQMVMEFFEDNNTGAGGLLGVGNGPDFTVSAVSGPPSAMGGQQFQAQVTVCNQGTSGASTVVDLALSPDEVFTTSELIGGQPIPFLAPGQCQTVQVQGGAWVPDGLWFLGAIADAFNGQAELIETNNARSGGVLAVGNGPDLTVAQVTAPPSATPGSSWQATVRVCNQGTSGGGAPVELFLSPDEAITSQDMMVGGVPGPFLVPGECRDLAVNSFSSPTGIWFVGAIVDTFNGTPELIETNNTRAGNRIGIDFLPDLVVSSVSGPPSVAPGAQSSVTVTVCNQGTTSASGSFHVVLSTDSTITSSDQLMSGGGTPTLSPGACSTQTVNITSGAPDGTYSWGAIVDTFNTVSELFEDNNAKAGNRVGFGTLPDLVVSSLTAQANVVPGGTINAAVTVCNQGTQSSSAQVDVFASSDDQISTMDFIVGSSGGPSLQPGQCSTLSVSGPAPGQGLYFLGAIADAPQMVVEFFEDNNTKVAAGRLGVGNGPDLTVSAVAGPAIAKPSDPVAVTLTFCNQGTQPGNTPVEVYLSTDATISPMQDFWLGGGTVSPLEAGQCAPLRITGTLSVPEGTYFIGAVADPGNGLAEIQEDNNAGVGAATLRVTNSGVDVAVTAASGPFNVRTGIQFNATFTACNTGVDSATFPVDVVLSADAVFDPGDQLLGGVTVGPLHRGQCVMRTIPATTFGGTGTFFLGAVADLPNGMVELSETNNASFSATQVGVGDGKDLQISSVSPPRSVMPGASFSTTVTICNRGTVGGSGGSTTQLLLSADGVASPDDFVVGSSSTSSLSPNGCTSRTITGPAPSAPGPYVAIAVADATNAVVEMQEGNNQGKAATVVNVGNGPDLEISSVTGPFSSQSGTAFTATVTVCNRGTASGSAPLEVRLSYDDPISTADFLVGGQPSPTLSPGGCSAVSVSATAPFNGAFVLGALVDPYGSLAELDEANNARAGAAIGVGTSPDLTFSALSGPAAVRPGVNFNVSATLCNRGQVQSATAPVEVRLSGDSAVTVDDSFAGSVSPAAIAPGACSAQTVLSNAIAAEGTYFLTAVVDRGEQVWELVETNNTRVGATITVDGTPPVQPTVTGTSPASPSRTSTTPFVLGTAEPSSTIRVFKTSNCTGAVASTGTASSTTGSFSVSVSVTANATTALSVTSTDAAGNVSPCSNSISYTHDSLAPAAPVLTGTNPSSPGNSTTPQVLGTAEVGSTVRLFTGGVCTGTAVATGVVPAGGSFSFTVTVAAGSTTSFVATATDVAGNVSACSAVRTYTHDSSAPGAPVLSSTSPPSPSSSTTPTVSGTAEANSTVRLFTAAGCGGAILASGLADGAGAFAIPATVTANATTTFFANSVDAAQNVSPCSSGLSYVHDSIAPATPSITSTTPASGSTSTTPAFNGSAESLSTVRLFTTATCSGAVAGQGQATAGGSFSISVSVAPDTATTLFANARDAALNTSGCSAGRTYVACGAGRADCDGNPANVCEVTTASDPLHCGACGNVCPGGPNATPTCSSSTCGLTCQSGFSDCDGNPANGCETAGCCAVDNQRELMITSLSVVNDPVRTTGMGAWTFGKLMQDMAPTPAGAPDFVKRWLETWMTPQTANGFTAAPRTAIQSLVLGPWQTASGGAGAPLNLSIAPFRLLAIVNRIDLRNLPNDAGEGRFIFGVLDGSGNQTQFTVIFEYKLPGTTAADVTQWAQDWGSLGTLSLGSAAYNTRLQEITDAFAGRGVAPGKPNGSSLGQIRTNEIAIGAPWQLREFVLDAVTGDLKVDTVKQTPDQFAWNNSSGLRDLINQNEAAILAGTFQLPNTFNSQPLLGAFSNTDSPSFFWNAPGINNAQARHLFSLNTCNGCHGGETNTPFLHVSTRSANSESSLSGFLTGITVFDPVTGTPRAMNDLQRRNADLQSLLCGGGGGGLAAPGKGDEVMFSPTVPGSNLPKGRVH